MRLGEEWKKIEKFSTGGVRMGRLCMHYLKCWITLALLYHHKRRSVSHWLHHVVLQTRTRASRGTQRADVTRCTDAPCCHLVVTESLSRSHQKRTL